MLAEALNVPFPRNTTRPRFESSVLSGHHLYSPHFRNVTAVIRDGRDVMVSAYYYLLFKNEVNRQFGVDHHRRQLRFADFDDLPANLPRFIEYMFESFARQRFHFSWSEFIDSWLPRGVPIVRYEQLLLRPAEILQERVAALTGRSLHELAAQAIVEKYSFRKLSGRQPGDAINTSFVRKGVAGDWKNHFSFEARQVFDSYAGAQLITAGYETDHTWADERC
jgi:hypothetical protein